MGPQQRREMLAEQTVGSRSHVIGTPGVQAMNREYTDIGLYDSTECPKNLQTLSPVLMPFNK
jgi:hypothetical protein